MQATGFLRNVLTMSGGAVLSQLIPIAASPLLARLYAPSDFGLLATAVAIAALLSFISTGRYELAIVMARNNREAVALACLSIAGTILVTLATILVIGFIVAGQFGNVSPTGSQTHLLLAIPIFASLLAIGQIANGVAHRGSAYARMAAANVWQQIASVVVSLAFGFLKITSLGLLAGRLAGLISFILAFVPIIRTAGKAPPIADFVDAARTHRQFPLYNLPFSILSSLTRDLLIFGFTFSGQLAAAGLYGMTRMVLQAPIYLLTGSLSQVYYKEAIDQGDTPGFRDFTFRLILTITLATVPVFMLLVWWAPDAFAIVFGERWREAGHYAAWLAFPVSLHAITCWPARLFEARGRQQSVLVLQTIFDLLSFATVATMLVLHKPPIEVVAAYAIIQISFHLFYLYLIFRLSNLAASQFAVLLATLTGLAGLTLVVGAALALIALPPSAAFILHALVVIAISSSGLLLSISAWKRVATHATPHPGPEQ